MFALEREIGFAEVARDYHQTIEKDHGRIETGRCWAISAPEFRAWSLALTEPAFTYPSSPPRDRPTPHPPRNQELSHKKPFSNL